MFLYSENSYFLKAHGMPVTFTVFDNLNNNTDRYAPESDFAMKCLAPQTVLPPKGMTERANYKIVSYDKAWRQR